MPRRALLLATLLAAVTVAPSLAAPAPQIVDPKGDAVGAQPGADLVSVTFSTTGTGAGRGYVAKKLLVTMTLAGDVLAQPVLTYEVTAQTGTCGEVEFTAEFGSPYSQVVSVDGWSSWGDCVAPGDDDNVALMKVAVKGNTITWSFPIKTIPKELKLGTVFSDFEARIDPTNPVVPFPSRATQTRLGLVDVATGTGTWKMR